MVIAVGGGEIERHRTGEIDGELRAGARIRGLGLFNKGFVGRVQEGGEAAEFAHVACRLGQRVVAIPAFDAERDRPEALFAIQVALGGGDAQHQRRRGARTGKLGMRIGLRVQQHAPPLRSRVTHLRDQRLRLRRLDGGQYHRRLARLGRQRAHRVGQALRDFRRRHGSRRGSAAGTHAGRRQVDVLRAGAHLRRKHAQRGRQALDHRVEVVAGIDHHRVDPRGLGERQRRMRVGLDPLAEAHAAGEVDDRRSRVLDDLLADRVGRGIERQRHQVGVETAFPEHRAKHLDRDRHRQHGRRMRLDDHRIAGGKAGHHRRPRIPGGKTRAGEAHRDTARHQPVGLVEADRGGPEVALPAGAARDPGHRLPRVDQRLDAAVQRIHPAAGVAHVVALPGGMHDRERDFEDARVEAGYDFHQYADAGVGLGPGPARVDRGPRCGEQRIKIGLRVGDAERRLRIGRDLFAEPPDRAGLVEREVVAQMRLEGAPARGLRDVRVRILARQFGEGAPARARSAGGRGLLEARTVLFEKVHVDCRFQIKR